MLICTSCNITGVEVVIAIPFEIDASKITESITGNSQITNSFVVVEHGQ